jgi:hypothetical protein
MSLESLFADRLEAYRKAAITDLWLRSAGLPETEVDRWARPVTYASLAASEWSPEFEQLMRNRLIMGALRYGRIGAPCKRQWDRVEGIRQRLDAYEEEGSLEMLVDVANLCLLEFCEGKHPLRHWPTPYEEEAITHVKEKST